MTICKITGQFEGQVSIACTSKCEDVNGVRTRKATGIYHPHGKKRSKICTCEHSDRVK